MAFKECTYLERQLICRCHDCCYPSNYTGIKRSFRRHRTHLTQYELRGVNLTSRGTKRRAKRKKDGHYPWGERSDKQPTEAVERTAVSLEIRPHPCTKRQMVRVSDLRSWKPRTMIVNAVRRGKGRLRLDLVWTTPINKHTHAYTRVHVQLFVILWLRGTRKRTCHGEKLSVDNEKSDF